MFMASSNSTVPQNHEVEINSSTLSALEAIERAGRWQRRADDHENNVARFNFTEHQQRILTAVRRHSLKMCRPSAPYENANQLARAAGIKGDNLHRALKPLMEGNILIEVARSKSGDKCFEFKLQEDASFWNGFSEIVCAAEFHSNEEEIRVFSYDRARQRELLERDRTLNEEISDLKSAQGALGLDRQFDGNARADVNPPCNQDRQIDGSRYLQDAGHGSISRQIDGSLKEYLKEEDLKGLKRTLKAEKISPGEKEFMRRCLEILGSSCMNGEPGKRRGDGGKWRVRYRSDPNKSERVIDETARAKKEGEIKTSPGQYAENIWPRFASRLSDNRDIAHKTT
jgi:hypothetical protein